MHLCWLTYLVEDDVAVVIDPAPSLIHARLASVVRASGRLGEFQEGHRLDVKTPKKVPKTLIGGTLSRAQAEG